MEKFIDTHQLTAASGRGGKGCVSFRREKYVPRGGPDGGDGGRGGDVIFRVNPQLSSLSHLYAKKRLQAENGQNGSGRQRNGRHGKNVVIEVPLGTLIKDENGTLFADLNKKNSEFLFIKGGIGGKGNASFASANNQAPDYAQPGLEGKEAHVFLEIKLIADIGLVGFPNAGKSTLISVITNARPKIADYPFTTLSPNLGIWQIDETANLIVADIPGILVDAHKGAGLGLTFLRHIERTRILLFVIEATAENPYSDFLKLHKELKCYSSRLYEKKFIIGISKIELFQGDKETLINKFPKELQERLFLFSAAAHQGLDNIRSGCYKLCSETA